MPSDIAATLEFDDSSYFLANRERRKMVASMRKAKKFQTMKKNELGSLIEALRYE